MWQGAPEPPAICNDPASFYQRRRRYRLNPRVKSLMPSVTERLVVVPSEFVSTNSKTCRLVLRWMPNEYALREKRPRKPATRGIHSMTKALRGRNRMLAPSPTAAICLRD